ncbi:MAG: diguanylate cyclase [Actinomycetota bacterium]|nr:diguanylate cyclase [Actinomycetota bacterium]
MESAPTPARVSPPVDGGLLAAAVNRAVAAAAEIVEPAQAIAAAVEALHAAVAGLFPSVFVFEHSRLWLVAQRGYAFVPDGLSVERGVMGRAIRLGRPQFVADVGADPDFVPTLPGVLSELAIPLLDGQDIVGAFNLESERALPADTVHVVRPLTSALAPLAEQVRAGASIDLPALARLFVHLGSIRDPHEIANLAAASLPRIVPLEVSQVVVWNELGLPVELASWSREASARSPLTNAELEAARAQADPNGVCDVLDVERAVGDMRFRDTVVWLPLRTNGIELGALVALGSPGEPVDPVHLDGAALLAAHLAASLDGAMSLKRERHSAVTDLLTGILNRRGLEERLGRELAFAQERRLPLSLLVIDCDDFKEINDRAGHEFGDALLYEIGRVLVQVLPDGAEPARFGGDEFVVMLAGAGVSAAEALGGKIRQVLAEGLTEAGFPLRISAGISTYPFDGATPSELLRAADQALYAAKRGGKDQIASFRDVVRGGLSMVVAPSGAAVNDSQRSGRAPGSVLADVVSASAAIEAEETFEGICGRLCKSLVFVIGATACSASRVVGDYLVDATEHALREVWLGEATAYRIADFPLTEEILRTGQPRAVSFVNGDVDPAEAFILRELGMNALLMLPLRVGGRPWGLVELYEMRLRQFTEDDVAVAEFLAGQAERRLQVVGAESAPLQPHPVYELPSAEASEPTPGTR